MGGSSGGGGGGSGVVDYPAYMKTFHEGVLGAGAMGGETVTAAMIAAFGASPWAATVAYDPAVDIAAYETTLATFAAILAGLDDTVDWAALYTQAGASIILADIPDTTDVTGITNALIVADVDNFADNLDDEITNKVLPRFQSGMLDINAVSGSAFVIGEAVIEGFRNREVAKHESTLRLAAAGKNADIGIENEKLHLEAGKINLFKNIDLIKDRLGASEQMLKLMIQRISWNDTFMKTSIEGSRVKIVASKEEIDVNLKIAENDALWDLQVFQYGANMLAAIGGGTAGTGKGPSTMQSVLGGAMSGAAAGTMVSPGYGTAIGAVLGAAAGYMSAS